MKDLTQGSIAGHILTMAAPVTIGMFAQIAYQLVDLYFVTRIGVAATAGVNAAGNIVFVIVALNQVLAIGTAALIAHAFGRQDQAKARLVFNQCLVLAVHCGATAVIFVYLLARPYLESVAADAATVDAGTTFLFWVLPGYALTFPMTALSSALRAAGSTRAAMSFQILSVIINVILAPVLIAGWGTGVALGVKGAGLATCLSILIGFSAFGAYCYRVERWMTLQWGLMWPQFSQWRHILRIGLPAGCDYALYFLYTAVVYYSIRDFGPEAQAGFGIGSRVIQTIALPGIAIGFAAGPIAGQNFGARNSDRVRETLLKASFIVTAIMVAAAILVQLFSSAFVKIFDADAETIVFATEFLSLTSWALVAQGLVCTCSSMFQGLGNTMPSLISSGVRFVTFAIPVTWVCAQPAFRIEQVWHLSVASLMLQAAVSFLLVRVEFNRRLLPIAAGSVAT